MISLLGSSSRRHGITFHPSGRIDICASLARTLRLDQGDVLDIIHYEGEYYLYVRHKAAELVGQHLAQCRPTKRGQRGSGMRLSCMALCRPFLALAPTAGAKVSFPTGSPTKLEGIPTVIPIITRLPHQSSHNYVTRANH